MTFGRSLLLKCTAMIAVGSLATTPALADVLELGPDGARWVAGGPAPQVPADLPMGGPMAGEHGAVDLTGVLPALGPGSLPSFSPLMTGRVSSNYGMRTHPILGGQRMHSGMDIAAGQGTPVYATAHGVVSHASWRGSYGLLVQLDHAASHQTRYGHLSQVTVQPGQIVQPGQLVGYVGSTGRSTGPHLHYEVRVRGVAVDPRPYMLGQ